MGFRILIITDSQALSESLERAFEPLPFSVLVAPADIGQWEPLSMQAYLEGQRVSVVIHAPFQPQVATTDNLAFLCGQLNLPLMHLSSYRVFGASQVKPDEAVIPLPDDDLGQHLWRLEQPVLALEHGLVLRLPWPLTYQNEGLLDVVCTGLLSGQIINVSEEACGCVLAWDDISRILVAMAQQIISGGENWGAFHLRTSDMCSEAEFADAVARLLKAEGCAVAGFTTTKGGPWLMPRTAVLVGRRCTDNFGIQLRSFRQGLKGQVLQWLQRSSLEAGPRAPSS